MPPDGSAKPLLSIKSIFACFNASARCNSGFYSWREKIVVVNSLVELLSTGQLETSKALAPA